MDDRRAAREQALRLEDREFLLGRRIASDTLRDVDREALRDRPIHAALERTDIANEGPNATGGEPKQILVLGVSNHGPQARIVRRAALDRRDRTRAASSISTPRYLARVSLLEQQVTG